MRLTCDICGIAGPSTSMELLISLDDDGPATLLACATCAAIIAEDMALYYEQVG